MSRAEATDPQRFADGSRARMLLWRPFMRASTVPFLILASAACSSSGSTTDAAGSSVGGGGAAASSGTGGQVTSTSEIGPEGGTLASADGVARLVVPAGAVEDVVTFSIGPADSAPAGHLGQAYEIGPSGTTFATPATVAILYQGPESFADVRVATAE